MALSAASPPAASPAPGFVARRWRQEVPPARLFWHDLVLVGTAVNVGFSFAALMLLALGQPLELAVAVHFLPLPYNLFLCLALWRACAGRPAYRIAGLAWLLLVTLI